eukprot:gene22822-biopygen963
MRRGGVCCWGWGKRRILSGGHQGEGQWGWIRRVFEGTEGAWFQQPGGWRPRIEGNLGRRGCGIKEAVEGWWGLAEYGTRGVEDLREREDSKGPSESGASAMFGWDEFRVDEIGWGAERTNMSEGVSKVRMDTGWGLGLTEGAFKECSPLCIKHRGDVPFVMKGSDDVLLCIEASRHARLGLLEIITFLKVGEVFRPDRAAQRSSFNRELEDWVEVTAARGNFGAGEGASERQRFWPRRLGCSWDSVAAKFP